MTRFRRDPFSVGQRLLAKNDPDYRLLKQQIENDRRVCTYSSGWNRFNDANEFPLYLYVTRNVRSAPLDLSDIGYLDELLQRLDKSPVDRAATAVGAKDHEESVDLFTSEEAIQVARRGSHLAAVIENLPVDLARVYQDLAALHQKTIVALDTESRVLRQSLGRLAEQNVHERARKLSAGDQKDQEEVLRENYRLKEGNDLLERDKRNLEDRIEASEKDNLELRTRLAEREEDLRSVKTAEPPIWNLNTKWVLALLHVRCDKRFLKHLRKRVPEPVALNRLLDAIVRVWEGGAKTEGMVRTGHRSFQEVYCNLGLGNLKGRLWYEVGDPLTLLGFCNDHETEDRDIDEIFSDRKATSPPAEGV